MCKIFFTTYYPCSHQVIVGWNACELGMHPGIYHPHKDTPVSYAEAKALGLRLPSACPVAIRSRPCIRVPCEPFDFAFFCLWQDKKFEDVIALAPVWVYGTNGVKVGTKRTSPSLHQYLAAYSHKKTGTPSLEQYTAAYGPLENRTSTRNRYRIAKGQGERTRAPKPSRSWIDPSMQDPVFCAFPFPSLSDSPWTMELVVPQTTIWPVLKISSRRRSTLVSTNVPMLEVVVSKDVHSPTFILYLGVDSAFDFSIGRLRCVSALVDLNDEQHSLLIWGQ